MIDNERYVYDKAARAVLAAFPHAYVTSKYKTAPAQFPAAWMRRASFPERIDMVDSSGEENGQSVVWEGQFFAEESAGGREQCKAVLAAADAAFRELGFTRSYCNEMDNAADASISRYVARWTGTVDKNGEIYGR